MGIRLVWVLIFLGVFFIIGIGWQFIELGFYGEVQPRFVDNIIGFALAASITLNISNIIKIE